MRGYIRRGGKASWEITVELGLDPVSGRRLRRTVSVKGTKRQAQEELTRMTNALVTGSYVDPGRETVGAFLERWLRDYATANVAPRTFDRYAEMVHGRLAQSFGSTRMTALRPSHIVAAEQTWRESGLAPSSVLKYHRLLHKALRDAVKWQTLAVNPVDAVTPPRAPRREMTALDADQAAALLDAARGHEYEIPLLTAVYTGLRLGELLGLRWADVDLASGRVSIQQTLQRLGTGGVTFGQPKTHRSRRAVSIPALVVEALKRQRHAQLEQRMAAGPAWQDGDLVFSDALGRPVRENRFRLHFRQLLVDAGLPHIRLHDLRHTMASLMLSAGEHPKVVSERLGHSTVNVTLDTYSHVLPGLQAAAAERLADVLSRPR